MAKKKVLLLTYGSRDHGSSRVSGLNHFDRFKADFDITWLPRTPVHKRGSLIEKITFAIKKQLFSLRQILAIIFIRYDLVYVQVMFLPLFCLKILKSRGTVHCYNVDDAIYTYSSTKFDNMMKYAEKVTVSTPRMKDYLSAFHNNIEFIYSPVDTDVITPNPEPHELFTIGWIGSQWTGPYLQSVEPAFKELAKQIKFKLVVVGAEIKMEGVNVECINWSEENEQKALRTIDVGIMPLPDDEWAKMKGGYKLFLYMAAGKPIVASPYGINASIVNEGKNGFLAVPSEDWLNAFLTLYKDKDLRAAFGKQARLDVEQNYSYNVCSKQLLDFLKK